MSSKKSVPPLQLEPRSSRQLALLFLLVYGAALAAIAVLPVSAWISSTLSIMVIVHFYFVFNTHVLGRGRRAVLTSVWDGDGAWTLVTGEHEELAVRLLPSSFVHPLLIVLNFASEKRGLRTLILLPDSVDRETRRRLLVRMHTDGSSD